MSGRSTDRGSWQSTPFLVVTALLQGGALWWLYDATKREYWPGTSPAWLLALASVAFVVPPLIYLLRDYARIPRVLAIAAAAAGALFGFGWHHGARVIGPARDIVLGSPGWGTTFGYSLAVIVLCVHALPFVQSWLMTGRYWPAYRDLFEFAWRNVILVALAVVFCGVFWALLGLWAQLFHMIGIGFFRELFTDSRFGFPATALAFAAGIGLAGSVERLQIAFREQILTLFKWLGLLALLILALFSLALLLKSPELFESQTRVISAAWLLWLVAFTVYLLNAAYQDGSIDRPYPQAISTAARAITPLLFVIAIMAAYALIVRVRAYGLTVDRVWGLVVAALALIYGAGYAYAARSAHPWMHAMGRVNVMAALVLIVLTSLLLTPLLSPYRLAAASHHARIVADEEPADEKRDGTQSRFELLRVQSGVYGRERLETLAKIDDVAGAARIRKEAQAALSRKLWYEPDAACPADPRDLALVALPAGEAIDGNLRQSLHELCKSGSTMSCTNAEEPCPVLFVDVNDDGAAEAIASTAAMPVAFTREGDRWRRVDVVMRRSGTGARAETSTAVVDMSALADAVAANDVEIVPAEWNRLRVGDSVLEFRDGW